MTEAERELIEAALAVWGRGMSGAERELIEAALAVPSTSVYPNDASCNCRWCQDEVKAFSRLRAAREAVRAERERIERARLTEDDRALLDEARILESITADRPQVIIIRLGALIRRLTATDTEDGNG